jgi:putative hydrolase of the HAD superfamily
MDTMTAEQVQAIFVEADGGGYTPKLEALERVRQRVTWKEQPDIEALKEHWFEHYAVCAIEMPRARETLIALRASGLKTGIVTNGSTRTQNTKVDLLNLRELVDAVIVSETVGIKKPDARIFQIALEEMQVEASEAIFVGDHPNNDVLGAQEANLAAVWMRGYHPWPEGESEPRWQVDRLTDVLELEL